MTTELDNKKYKPKPSHKDRKIKKLVEELLQVMEKREKDSFMGYLEGLKTARLL